MKKQKENAPIEQGEMPELEIVSTQDEEVAVSPEDTTPEEAATDALDAAANEKDETAAASEKAETAAVAEQEKSAIQQIRDFVNDDEEKSLRLNFKAFVGGDGLVKMVARNWCFIIVIVVFTCCYVSSRYMMEAAKVENAALKDTLIDRRYKALTAESQLKERMLSSHVEANLKDSTIHTPTDQAFTLKAK